MVPDGWNLTRGDARRTYSDGRIVLQRATPGQERLLPQVGRPLVYTANLLWLSLVTGPKMLESPK